MRAWAVHIGPRKGRSHGHSVEIRNAADVAKLRELGRRGFVFDFKDSDGDAHHDTDAASVIVEARRQGFIPYGSRSRTRSSRAGRR